jgi:C-terminal processing protease CtpA/Prc
MGVTVGDKLQSIAGRPTDGLGRNAIQFMLRGNPGTRVDVELRAADGRRRIVSLERGVRD